jgi:hypothetical protein
MTPYVDSNVPIEPKIELRGRLRRAATGDRFRLYLLCYEIPHRYRIKSLDLAIERNRKVCSIVKEIYHFDSDHPEIKEWCASAIETIDQILPSLEPLRFPTHFFLVGFEINQKEQPFFKTFMCLDGSTLSASKSAEQICCFLFHWGESHQQLDLNGDQDWVLHCLLSQWRLIRSL